MDPQHIYSLLQQACSALDDTGEHAIAAHVSYAMSLVTDRFGVGRDHLAPIDADED